MKNTSSQWNILFLSTLMGIAVWIACPSVEAYIPSTTTTPFPINDYQAQYQVSWHGLYSGASTHKLKRQPNGQYLVESRTDPKLHFLPFHYFESSQFTWKDGKILPQRYTYNIQEGKKHRVGNVNFDWPSKTISNYTIPHPWIAEIPDDIHDKLTQTLHLRFALKSGQKEYTYTVAERDKIKDYHFKIVGYERIKTKLGTLNTVKVETYSARKHKTTTWMATDMDYLPVRMEHERNGKVAATGEIQSWQKLG